MYEISNGIRCYTIFSFPFVKFLIPAFSDVASSQMVFKAVLLAAIACVGTTSAVELTPATYAEATAGKRLF
jgi:hypothetical protein